MRTVARSIDWAARMFQALVMLFVVAGHAHSGGFDGPFQLFPVASFHVAGFSFVSGYLYSDRHDPSPGPFILARVRRLLVPMLAIYGVYGLVTVALDAVFGFSFRGGYRPPQYCWPPFSRLASSTSATRCGSSRPSSSQRACGC